MQRGRDIFLFFLKKKNRRSEGKLEKRRTHAGVGDKGGFVVYGRRDVHVSNYM